MTVSPPGHPATDDPQASLRTALLGKLVGAQMALEKAIGELIRNGVSTSAADAQLSYLAGLQTTIGTASAAALAAMSGEVATAVAQSKTVTENAREQAAAASAGSAVALADAARDSRTAVAEAMDAARNFQLNFTSPADEAAYRERENERRRYIAEQNAKGTPMGNLNAAGAGVGQLVDAKTHGAHGPEFDKQWTALVATTEKLREQVRASGGSTKEFDDHLRADLRQIMKSKGLSDADIDARFAANPDPLEAAKAYVADADITTVRHNVAHSYVPTPSAPLAAEAVASPPATASDPNATFGKLRLSRLAVADHPDGAAPDHGVTLAASPVAVGRGQA